MALFFSPSAVAFYDDGIPVPLPEDAISVSEADREALLIAINSGGSFELVNGKPVPVPPEPELLSVIKVALRQHVDAQAEAERLKYITPGTGQAMTYQQKVAEAQAYKSATNPKPADYPILASEVGITAPTLSEVADTVLDAYRQWQQIGVMIEAVRLGAKRDIDAAENEAAAHTVVDSVVWPSAQQGGTDNE